MLLCALCEGVEVVVRAGSEICDGASCGRTWGGTQAVTSGAAARWFEDYYVVEVSAGGVFLKLSRCFVRLLEVVRTGTLGEELRPSWRDSAPPFDLATEARYWCLLIRRRLILDSSVDDEIPRRVAAPDGPNTRPLVSSSARSISRRSLDSIA